MIYKIKKMTISLFAFIVCMLLIIVVDYYDYKNNTNEQIIELEIEIAELKNEIEELKRQISEIEKNTPICNCPEETTEINKGNDTKAKSVFSLSDYQRRVVEYIVTGESIGEPYDGQVAVAQCVLNACLKDGIQPSEVRTKYKYSGWNTNPTESVKKAVSAVFDDGYKITDKYILYFYAPKYSKGSWHETQQFVMEIGGHRFFAEK